MKNSPILSGDQFAKFNARQIFLLYGITEMAAHAQAVDTRPFLSTQTAWRQAKMGGSFGPRSHENGVVT